VKRQVLYISECTKFINYHVNKKDSNIVMMKMLNYPVVIQFLTVYI